MPDSAPTASWASEVKAKVCALLRLTTPAINSFPEAAQSC